MARECHCPRSHGALAPSPTEIPRKCWNGKTNFPPLPDQHSSACEALAVGGDCLKSLERKIDLLMDCHDCHDARLRNLEEDQVLWKLEKDDERQYQRGIERVDSLEEDIRFLEDEVKRLRERIENASSCTAPSTANEGFDSGASSTTHKVLDSNSTSTVHDAPDSTQQAAPELFDTSIAVEKLAVDVHSVVSEFKAASSKATDWINRQPPSTELSEDQTGNFTLERLTRERNSAVSEMLAANSRAKQLQTQNEALQEKNCSLKYSLQRMLTRQEEMTNIIATMSAGNNGRSVRGVCLAAGEQESVKTQQFWDRHEQLVARQQPREENTMMVTPIRPGASLNGVMGQRTAFITPGRANLEGGDEEIAWRPTGFHGDSVEAELIRRGSKSLPTSVKTSPFSSKGPYFQ